MEPCTAFVARETAEMLGMACGSGADGRVWMVTLRRRGRAGDGEDATVAAAAGGGEGADVGEQMLVRLRVHDDALACASSPRPAVPGDQRH